jgi:hypothetical protein
MARANPAVTPARRGPASGARFAAPALTAALAAAAGADALRIGFFADDFHFLDVARRVPLLRALGGAFGIYPWYRPLSRELFFALISKCGAAGSLAAHLASLACVVLIAWLLLRLASRIAGDALAPLAPALFVTYEYTRFLTAWASGFQDLLAVALVLLAILDHARGRNARSALWSALAPLAKETGFVALPLTLLYAFTIERERAPRRWMIAPALATLGAAALHLIVRLTWRGAGSTTVIHAGVADLPAAMRDVVVGFFGRWAGPPAPATLGCALLAALAAALLLWRARRAAPAAPLPAVGALAFAAIASAMGLAPMAAGAALRLTLANPYYAFPAAPFLCVLACVLVAAAPRTFRRIVALLLPPLVAWNVLALGIHPPSPLEPSAWTFHRWDWREAERLDVVSARLAADLRAALAQRPESLVVLYGGLPTGSFFQSEDGPATRVVLGDPSVRAWYINGVPQRVERGRFAVLMFDPAGMRLVADGMPPAERLRAAATAIFRGQAGTAWAYASWADARDEAQPDRAYARAAAVLLMDGAAPFRAALAAGGLADSLGARPVALAAAEFPADAPLRATYESVLRSPLDAARHGALADSLLARGYTVAGGFELRVAVTLDPARDVDAARLRALLEADASGVADLPRPQD